MKQLELAHSAKSGNPAAPDPAGASVAPIARSRLDPVALDLGLASGLLGTGPTPETVTVSDAWLDDPLTGTAAGFRTNGRNVAALLGELMGRINGNALAIPAKDPATLGTWYPIPRPDAEPDTPPTGLYVVTYEQGDDQIFGLGVKASWTFGTPPAGPIQVTAWGMLPVLRSGPSSTGAAEMLVLGGADNPMTLGISVTSPNGPLIDVGGLSLDGGQLSVRIRFDADDPIDVSLAFLQLKLPDEKTPRDRTLADLQTMDGAELLRAIAGVAVSTLSSLAGAGDRGRYLLPIFGLTSAVPGSEVRLPILEWFSLLTQAESQDLARPFREWFNALAGDPAKLEAWMGCIGKLLLPDAEPVSGSGTRSAPFATPVIALSDVGSLSFTMASDVTPAGMRTLYPGLTLRSRDIPLGNSDIALALDAALELLQFKLAPSGGVSGVTSLRFDAGIALVNRDRAKPLFDGAIGPAHYTIGTLKAGLTLTDSLAVVPGFLLTGVDSPAGKFETLDLSSPSKVADAAQEQLIAAIDAALQALLGVDPGSSQAVPFASNVAALIGVIKPTNLPEGAVWPMAELPPPFSAGRLVQSLANPIAALGTYYARLLAPGTEVGGKQPFVYLLGELAGMLKLSDAGTGPIPVDGAGTADDPWRAAVGVDALPAFVTASAVIDGAARRLTLGLRLAPSVAPGGTTIAFQADLQVLALTFPAEVPGPATAVRWLPAVRASLSLPRGGTTPPVFGASFSLDGAELSGGWNADSGWSWSAVARRPAVVIGDQTLPVADVLDFSDPEALRRLVTDGGKAFAPVLVGILGVALSRAGTRGGVAASALFGLLPDLTGKLPDGLVWPSDMPQLTITALDDPLPDLTRQLAGLVESTDHAKAALTLLAWALQPSLDKPPELAGTGSPDDPFRIDVAEIAPLRIAAWIDPAAKSLGVGLIHPQALTVGGIDVTIDTTLRAVDLGFAGSTAAFLPLRPGLGLSLSFRKDGGLLVDLPDAGIVVAEARLSLALGLTDGGSVEADWTIRCDPPPQAAAGGVAGVYLAAGQPPAGGADQSLQETALALVIQAIGTAMAGNPTWTIVYDLLTAAGITVAADPAAPAYGLNVGGWRALVADPTTALAERTLGLLAVPETRSKVFDLLWRLSGIEPVEVPAPVLALFQALGVVGDAAHGHPLRADAVLALARHPFRTVADRFSALAADGAAVAALVGSYGASLIEVDFWFLRFAAKNTTSLSLAVRSDAAPTLGRLLTIGGSLALDLRTFGLTVGVEATVQGVGLRVMPTLTIAPTASAVTAQSRALTAGVATASAGFGIAFAWGNPALPAPPPLQVYPFAAKAFLDGLADLAPQYALSAFVTGLMQSRLLASYPLAQGFFEGIGLALKNPDGSLRMPSILGLLEDPLGWFEALDLLNIKTLHSVLGSLPDAGLPGGLSLQAIDAGKRIAGLPYGFRIDLTVDPDRQLATFAPGLDAALTIADGKASLQTMSLGLTLDSTFQPGVVGSVAVTGTVPGNQTIVVKAGYDGAFTLSVGQSKPDGMVFDLVPFMSWTTLVTQLLPQAEQALLRTVTTLLLDELAKREGAAEFIGKMRGAATDLEVPALVDRLIAAQADPARMEQEAIGWLRDRISDASIAKTSTAIATLLGTLVPGFTAADGLVTYKPDSRLAVTVTAGLDGTGEAKALGLWVEMDHTVRSLVDIGITRTGVSIPVSGAAVPSVSFGARLRALVEAQGGPTLAIAFDASANRIAASIDPLGNDSILKRELLPTLFGVPTERLPQAIADWLGQVMLLAVPRYLVNGVLAVDAVNQWMDAGIVPRTVDGKTVYEGPTPGGILTGSLVLLKTDGPPARYVLNSLDALQSLTIGRFLRGFFTALLSKELQVLQVRGGGIWIAEPKQMDGRTAYGMRLAVPDLSLPGLPNVVFQIGAKDDGWIADTGGDPKTLKPGLSFLVPMDEEGPDFAAPILDLVNIGLDVVGTNGKPLVDFTRFQLGAVRPRGLVELDFGATPVAAIFGGAVTLADIAISLAPNTVTGGDNAVVQSLLGSGAKDAGDQKNPPTNPAFSIQAGYLRQPSGGSLAVGIFDSDGSRQTKVWLPVQRSFGPLHVNKIGAGWVQEDYRFLALFDGGLSLFGLDAAVQDLEIGIPVRQLTDYSKYTLDLAGLDVSFRGGSVEIAGGFLKTEDEATGDISYTGAAVVRAGKYGLTAFGSFAMMSISDQAGAPKAPSLFIFAALSAPLGGIPEFFITGLSGGFAVNRDLIVPDIGEITEFPLVKGAIEPGFFDPDKPGEALAKLNRSVPPKIGAYWIAAGLQFTTYKLLDTLALATVQFGSTFGVNLIGVATIAQPPETGKDKALIYLELGIKLSFRPADGVFSMEAQLTPNSFVLARKCKVTGGFAFYLWFQADRARNIPAGDFVLSVGGYSPRFDKPSYYPAVPNLGINWMVSEEVGVVGGAYMALTPSAFMVGGYLNATFQAGPLRAWFKASADFVISWQPFWFVAAIDVSVGVALDLDVLGVHTTLSAELGASLDLEGPPVHGSVHVSWFVISFSIPFGDGPDPDTRAISWNQFASCFLPQPSADAVRAVRGTDAPEPQLVVKATSEFGLLAQRSDADGDVWTLNTQPIALRIETAIPATQVTVATLATTFQGIDIGVQPMEVAKVATPLTLALEYRKADGTYETVDLGRTGLTFTAPRGGAPGALWSKDSFDPDAAPAAKVLSDALQTIRMAGTETVDGPMVGPIDIEKAFEFTEAPDLPLAFDLMPDILPAGSLPQGSYEEIMQRIGTTVMDPTVAVRRNALLDALSEAGVYAPANPDLSVMAHYTSTLFQAPPVMAKLSETVSSSRTGFGRIVAVPPPAAERPRPEGAGQAPASPRRLGTLHRYLLPALESTIRRAPPTPPRVQSVYLDLTVPSPATAAIHARGNGGDGGDIIRLFDGGLALWEVPADAKAVITPQAGAPLRIVAFDRHNGLLYDRIVSRSKAHPLPAGTAHVAVQHAGHLRMPRTGVLGWSADTELFLANRAHAIGDGFTVRPQSEPRRRRKGRMQRHGLISAQALTARNDRVTATDPQPGWVETTFPSRMRELVLTVRQVDGDVDAAAAQGTPATACIADSSDGHRTLAETAVLVDGDVTRVLYVLPETGPGRLVRVLARPAAGWRLVGCHATAGEAARIAAPSRRAVRGGLALGIPPAEAVAVLTVEPL